MVFLFYHIKGAFVYCPFLTDLFKFIGAQKRLYFRIRCITSAVTNLFLRLFSENVGGNLCHYDSHKDQHASHDLGCVHGLGEPQPARKSGKNRFEAHGQGGGGDIGVLLPDDLQGIGHARRHDARIEDGRAQSRMAPMSGVSKISMAIPDSTVQTANWMQDILTQSTEEEK